MGLAGIDVERAAAGVAAHHTEARPLPGRDLSGLITGTASAALDVATPIYFMTEDDITRGLNQNNVLTGAPFDAGRRTRRTSSRSSPRCPTGADGAPELWKLNHYYERLDDWNADHGIAANPFAPPAAEPVFEMHNLTTDPEERHNLVDEAPDGTEPTQVRPRRATRREAARAVASKPVALRPRHTPSGVRSSSISSMAACCWACC